MAPLAMAASLSIDSQTTPSRWSSHARGPSMHELDSIELADHGNLTGKSPHRAIIMPKEPQTPEDAHITSWSISEAKTPNELEHSEPPTPKQHTAKSILPTFFYPRMNKWRVLSACLIYFGNGMSDSAPGALIPYVEEYYHIGYAVVSLIWIANAIGFILAAFFNDLICGRLGRAKSLMFSESCMIVAYTIIACAPPFPVVVVAYLIMGFGNALNLALNNVFCANLADSTLVLGWASGAYGIGGIVAPIMATGMVSNGILWSRFYITTLGIRILCCAFAGWAFWNYESEDTARFSNSLHLIASRQAAEESREISKLKMLGRALKNRTTLFGAAFIFAYQGAEVSDSGWFISYLIDYRDAAPQKVGYVTAGFWAGITVGRFTLTHLAHRIGEKRFVFAMGIGAIVFQLLAWQIPSIIGNSVAVAILGLLLGPIYPCGQTIFSRVLPANLQVIAISFISSAGSSGGAIVPFVTGLLAQSTGTYVLHPICIGFFTLMLTCWVLLPKVRKVAAE